MYILVRTCMEGFIGNTQSNINNPEGVAQGIIGYVSDKPRQAGVF